MSTPPSQMPVACLKHEDLSAYASGKLPEERVGTVREHLKKCPQCSTLFGQLEENGEDSLIDLLRRVVKNPIAPRTSAAPATTPFLEESGHAGASAEMSTAVGETSATVADVTLPSFIGPYEILEEIRSGGMGVVYRAKQPSLDRHIALKRILPSVVTAEFVQRFRKESRVIAQLQHPHVIEIFEFGDHEGQPYYTMELMEGGSLAETLERGRLSNREAGELLHTLSRAVDDVHQEGVFHRDLKPANVLFTKGGVPKIGDFGLAKFMARDGQTGDELTDPDAVMGTPSYMAPEQARGNHDDIGPATDVYALGAILYRVLTGELVFRGKNKLETLDMVREQAPIRPLAYVPTVDVNLEAICLKCLAKDPQHRYPTAGALAEDLRCWLDDGTPLAQHERAQANGRRFVRRAGIALAMLLLCMFAVPGLAMFFGEQPLSQTEDAEATLGRIQQRLARREKVLLFGQGGKPPWYEIKGGSIAPKGQFDREVGSNKDGSAYLDSTGFALAQLVRDPQLDHYRLRAEIRYDASGFQECSGGVFVAHRELVGQNDAVRLVTIFGFNEIEDAIARYHRRQAMPVVIDWYKRHKLKPPPPPKGNRARLISYVLLTRGQYVFPESKLVQSSTVFQRHIGKVGRFRTLQVDVRPGIIRAYWDHERNPIEITWAPARKELHKDIVVFQKEFPTPLMANLKDEFPGRGGVGVYVRNSKISFRNVEIEPLPMEN